MWKSLAYYWRIQLAVLAATAVTCAVFTGALLIGDSLKGSLKELSLERLGRIDYALVSSHFVRSELAKKLNTVPAIFLNGSATSTKSGTRASRVQIQGIDASFFSLFEIANPGAVIAGLQSLPGQIFPGVIINEELQKELSVQAGDEILLSFEQVSSVHRESVLGSRNREDVTRNLRVIVRDIRPTRGMGDFGLLPNQYQSKNAFVSLDVLQKILNQKDRINALYASGNSPQMQIRNFWTTDDMGWVIQETPSALLLESKEVILKQSFVEEAKKIAAHLQTQSMPVLTYLANTMEANGALTPYSTITAIDPSASPAFGKLTAIDGSPVTVIRENEILVDEWLAKDLSLLPGQDLQISYYTAGAGNELQTARTKLRVAGIVRMEGFAADAKLTPEYPGIQNAKHISEWSPPFPVDLNMIRPKDEEYWEQHQAAPKGFVSLSTGLKLWSSRFGSYTSVRIAVPSAMSSSQFHDVFASKLLAQSDPARYDLIFQPVKQQALTAASGSTDFASLFLGFSSFLILSSTLLAGLLFRLGVEQRAAELGLLFASGYPLNRVRRKYLTEGALLACAGILPGIVLAYLYSWLLIVAFRSWWLEAIGTPFLQLHIGAMSLAIGAFSSFLACMLAVFLALRKLSRLSPITLLAGYYSIQKGRSGSRARILSLIFFIIAFIFIFAAFRTRLSPGLFFAGGFCMLAAGLSFFTAWLRGSHERLRIENNLSARVFIPARNTARNPGRSLLSIALVSSACFVLLAVGANRREANEEAFEKSGGTGGFSTIADSDIPLQQNLNSPKDRAELGITESEVDVHVYSFRVLPGDDISCLNLYQPQRPRLLGASEDFIRRGGFHFQQSAGDQKNPWDLLNQDAGENTIPAIGDFNSVQWILHRSLNDTIPVQSESGNTVNLKIVGLLQESIFQSELVISERNYLKYFPGRSGFSSFLIEVSPQNRDAMIEILESSLKDYGFDASRTEDRLASYKAVERTYISTFQTLGGLGMLLGTLGLGIVLIRNVTERRGELATLRAFGFRRSVLMVIVLIENAFLLFAGVFIGSVSAAIAVAPFLLQNASAIPWNSLAITLVLVLVIGMLSSIAAVSAALRVPLLPALKAES